MVLTEFLKNLTSGSLATLAQQALAAPQTITSQQVSPQVAASESFQQAATIFQNILSGGELPETFRQRITTENLLGLGQASLDISSALNEQITIREQQLAKTTEAIRNQAIATESINERLGQQVTQIGKSLGDISKGQFDPFKFLTDNPLIGGIGIGGLAVGAVVLLLLIRR